MDSVPVTHAPEPATPPAPSASRGAIALTLLVALAALLGLGGWIAVTVQSKTAEQARLATQRDAAAAASRQPRDVEVVHAASALHTPEVELSGNLEPVRHAEVGFEVAGRVQTVTVALGDTVTAGQVLASLDRATIGAQQAQTTASIDVARANVAMIEDRLRRVETLVARGASPEAELTAIQQQLALARAQVTQAESARRSTATYAADHVLRAPFGGVVTRAPTAAGAVIGPGQALFRIEDLSSLRLRTTVSEADLPGIRVGTVVRLVGSDAVGEVRAVVRSLDTQTHRAPVEVLVPNPDGALVANSLVHARVATGEPERVLTLPATAVRLDGTAFVVGEGERVTVREVVAQTDADGRWLVRSGVTAEDRVVARATEVDDGDVVHAVLAAPRADAATPSAAVQP